MWALLQMMPKEIRGRSGALVESAPFD